MKSVGAQSRAFTILEYCIYDLPHGGIFDRKNLEVSHFFPVSCLKDYCIVIGSLSTHMQGTPAVEFPTLEQLS